MELFHVYALVQRHVDLVFATDSMRHPSAVTFTIQRKFADKEATNDYECSSLLSDHVFDGKHFVRMRQEALAYTVATQAAYRSPGYYIFHERCLLPLTNSLPGVPRSSRAPYGEAVV